MSKPKEKYAWTATVGEKGQIVIAKQARELFNIKSGDTLVLLGDVDRGIAIPRKTMFSQFTNAIFETMPKPKGKYAWTATVGEKGQIVIAKQAREVFDIKPGDTLVILGDMNRGIAIPPKTMFSQFANAIFETTEDDE